MLANCQTKNILLMYVRKCVQQDSKESIAFAAV